MIIWYGESGTEIKRFPSARSMQLPDSGRPVAVLFNTHAVPEFKQDRDPHRIAIIHLKWGQHLEMIPS